MKSQSSTQQPLLQIYQGKILISFNQEQKTKQGMMGIESYWVCDQVSVLGVPTKSAIIEAITSDLGAINAIEVAKLLDTYKDSQDEQYAALITEYKATHQVIAPTSVTALTKDQKAGYLALVDFQEKLESDQQKDYEAYEKSLAKEDYGKLAKEVAKDVLTELEK